MRRAACALVVCAGLFPVSVAEAGKATWHTEFEAAKAEAEQLNLPLLVHFYAEWCGPCRSMESGVLNAPEVLAACGTKCVAVKVDTDTRGDLAAKYGVAGLPTDVFVSPEGDVLAKNVGPANKDAYVARMEQAGDKCTVCERNLAEPEQATADVSSVLTELAEDGGIGLDGYSPVSLTSGKVWREGSPEFVWHHGGVIYFMADAEELEQFKKSPEKYAPRLSGFDPLILSTEKVPVPGQKAYGSFYEGRLHLHATEESRAAFMDAPEKYPVPQEIEVPAQIARQKPPVVAHVPTTMGS
jgi:thiol-disulfide isomerase/thioredoxin/YHS domain-containing protein